MKINTLGRFLCTLSIGALLLLGGSLTAEAQRRYPPSHAPAYGLRNQRPYGEQVSARRHYRNALRRDLMRHQRYERRALNQSWRTNRSLYGNSRDLRYQRRLDRETLKVHQRQERSEFKARWKNNRKG